MMHKLPHDVVYRIFKAVGQAWILHAAATSRKIRLAVTDECSFWRLGPKADDGVVRAVTQLFGNLSHVEGGQTSWKASRSIADQGIQALCVLRETITKVSFPWLSSLSDNAIRMLAFDCTLLHTLNISEACNLSN